MNYEIILATNNQAKVEEIKKFFQDYTVTFLTLQDMKLKLNPKETGRTFLENALLKAKAVSKHVNKTVLADDSGLQIDALKGFPGVYSSRWMQDKSWLEKNQEILRLMAPHKNRKAQFSTAFVILYPHQEMLFFVGTTIGKITREVNPQTHGFGYDPIFFSDELGKTFSEATIEEKNQVSHRGKAAAKLLECLLNKRLITKVKKRI
ncbi:MAG: RdgB/HAM1 family non-canonical purine NTP pyrophosphatase [Bacilli bacterium]